MADETKKLPVMLILEDEAQLLATYRANLENEFDIESAGTVDEALMLLGTRNFDLLLSDQMLPGKKQGLDFLIEAMRRQPNARRILLTGYLNPELLARGTAMARLSACLLKPVEMTRLRDTLYQALLVPPPE
jgi:response regulator RpfG family c-di-GMP phosphodiesterase